MNKIGVVAAVSLLALFVASLYFQHKIAVSNTEQLQTYIEKQNDLANLLTYGNHIHHVSVRRMESATIEQERLKTLLARPWYTRFACPHVDWKAIDRVE